MLSLSFSQHIQDKESNYLIQKIFYFIWGGGNLRHYPIYLQALCYNSCLMGAKDSNSSPSNSVCAKRLPVACSCAVVTSEGSPGADVDIFIPRNSMPERSPLLL